MQCGRVEPTRKSWIAGQGYWRGGSKTGIPNTSLHGYLDAASNDEARRRLPPITVATGLLTSAGHRVQSSSTSNCIDWMQFSRYSPLTPTRLPMMSIRPGFCS